MSSDRRYGCPCCKDDEGVGIYGLIDLIILNQDGTIKIKGNVSGTCRNCGKRFSGDAI